MTIYAYHYSNFLTSPLADFYPDYTSTLGGLATKSACGGLARLPSVGSHSDAPQFLPQF
jgi:hypothetical protein